MRKTRAQFAAATAFWGLVATLYVLQTWWLTRQLGNRGPQQLSSAALVYTSLMYLAWVPLTVLVWRTTAGWTAERLGWLGFFARHIALFLGAATVHNAVMAAASSMLFKNPPDETFAMMFASGMRSRSYTELIIYSGVFAAGQALALYDRWRDRDRQAAMLEADLAHAQLSALQAQIQPHFLFNSLHTIASLAREGRNAEVVKLIADLSALLRTVTDQPTSTHALADEVEMVRRYLSIQQVRFGDRLRVDIDVPESAAAAHVPALTLQPLVDNAVRHGVGTSINGGAIRIRACLADGRLLLDVTDDASSVPPGWTLDTASGTGLKNLRSRLAILYGGRAEFHAGPGPNGHGFSVQVSLPAQPASRPDEPSSAGGPR